MDNRLFFCISSNRSSLHQTILHHPLSWRWIEYPCGMPTDFQYSIFSQFHDCPPWHPDSTSFFLLHSNSATNMIFGWYLNSLHAFWTGINGILSFFSFQGILLRQVSWKLEYICIRIFTLQITNPNGRWVVTSCCSLLFAVYSRTFILLFGNFTPMLQLIPSTKKYLQQW